MLKDLGKKLSGLPGLVCSTGFSGRKKYKLVFHEGSFKKKSIKVWYSKAQFLGFREGVYIGAHTMF